MSVETASAGAFLVCCVAEKCRSGTDLVSFRLERDYSVRRELSLWSQAADHFRKKVEVYRAENTKPFARIASL